MTTKVSRPAPAPRASDRNGEASPPVAFPPPARNEAGAPAPSNLAGVSPRGWLARILIVTALVLSPCLGHEFVFDDWDQIVNNRYLGNWHFVWKSFASDVVWFRNPLMAGQSHYYRPLNDVWLALNFRLFGAAPIGWHAAAIALHLLVVWLVYRVASILAGASPGVEDRWTGVLTAALFALMPIHAEPIAYVAAVAAPLAAAFELGAFELYLRRGPERDGALRLAASLGLFGCALLTYESAVVFPLLVVVHAFLFSSNRFHASYRADAGGARDAIAAAWPYAILSAAYLILRYRVLGFIFAPQVLNPPPALAAALTMPLALATDLTLLFMPWRAAPTHPLRFVHSLASSGFYLPAIGLVALFAGGFMLLRRHPHRRLYLFCAAWILIAIAPTLNLRALLSAAAIQDRYLYLPSFGFCLMAASLIVSFGSGDARRTRAAAIVAGAIAVAYGAMLFSAERYWRDEIVLFSKCVKEEPNAWIWRNALGMTRFGRGDLAGARRDFEAAHSLDPNQVGNLYFLGLLYEKLGDYRDAEKAITERMKLLKYPSAGGYAGLAFAADGAGDAHEAESALARAAALPDGAVVAALARAQLRFRHGDAKGAAQFIGPLLAHPPEDVPTLIAIGTELAAEHRYADALAPYRDAGRIDPHYPGIHRRLASVLHELGRDREARTECAAELAEAPNDRGTLALMAAIERGGGAVAR
ncbi:MAG: tetratricopeptide repeat protein [Candidatus Binataceae bacterium]